MSGDPETLKASFPVLSRKAQKVCQCHDEKRQTAHFNQEYKHAVAAAWDTACLLRRDISTRSGEKRRRWRRCVTAVKHDMTPKMYNLFAMDRKGLVGRVVSACLDVWGAN